ncbi:hypothetical protein Pcinc_004567 [Petrolisthes cinctipes]|uniref:Uncharacterized protein n=1 Tax=Petrolisthes cinctipes TaxID=88211 RepID=A0AAE1FLZ1_PETCI|nr:hypothetical protein Pcinc_019244 [Petrolisthes cinctipes]KAK3891543.1 hypothetical protein Pcinc_004567 [Petrolisthes cinctipes]
MPTEMRDDLVATLLGCRCLGDETTRTGGGYKQTWGKDSESLHMCGESSSIPCLPLSRKLLLVPFPMEFQTCSGDLSHKCFVLHHPSLLPTWSTVEWKPDMNSS